MLRFADARAAARPCCARGLLSPSSPPAVLRIAGVARGLSSTIAYLDEFVIECTHASTFAPHDELGTLLHFWALRLFGSGYVSQ
jgi:hypothetical protein